VIANSFLEKGLEASVKGIAETSRRIILAFS